MPGRDCFSGSYSEARTRFRALAQRAGATLEAIPFDGKGPDGGDLSLDLAWIGPRDAERVVVVSSGLHGVEGHMGSAVQLRLLEQLPARHEDVALVLLHGLNPYGFAHTRRVDAQNIDLNRNLLLDGERWEGAPAGYAAFDRLLNPPRKPRRVSHLLFPLRAIPRMVRHGLPTVKTIVAGGQYAFPKGLFFGGNGPSQTLKVLTERVPQWFGGAKHLLHVDFHTGLGVPATYKLLVDHRPGTPRMNWLIEKFGDAAQPWDAGEGVAYAIRGGLGTWMKQALPACEVDVLACEFGTVNVLAVITALHCENRAHLYGSPDEPKTKAAKARMMRAFAPSDPAWRDKVVDTGADVVGAALAAVR